MLCTLLKSVFWSRPCGCLQCWSTCSPRPPRPSDHRLCQPTTLGPVVDWGNQSGTQKTTTGRTSIHREIFVKEGTSVKTRLRKARKLHYSSKIDVCSTTKKLFAVSDELPGKAKTTPLPFRTPTTFLWHFLRGRSRRSVKVLTLVLMTHHPFPTSMDLICLYLHP